MINRPNLRWLVIFSNNDIKVEVIVAEIHVEKRINK